jgi:hypothetical protein
MHQNGCFLYLFAALSTLLTTEYITLIGQKCAIGGILSLFLVNSSFLLVFHDGVFQINMYYYKKTPFNSYPFEDGVLCFKYV